MAQIQSKDVIQSGPQHPSPKRPGPRTPQGKERTKNNATRHGFAARVLKGGALGESQGNCKKLVASFREAHQPVGGFEEFLVEKLAVLALRMIGVYRADAKIAPLLFEVIRKGLAGVHSPDIMEWVNRKDEIVQLTPELLLRYEGSLERQFDRTLTQLERAQRTRLGQPVPPPVKVELS